VILTIQEKLFLKEDLKLKSKILVLALALGIIIFITGCVEQPPETPPENPPIVPPEEPPQLSDITVDATAPSTALVRRNVEISGIATYDKGIVEVIVNFKGAGVEGIDSFRTFQCDNKTECAYSANQEYASPGTYTVDIITLTADYQIKTISKTITVSGGEAQ